MKTDRKGFAKRNPPDGTAFCGGDSNARGETHRFSSGIRLIRVIRGQLPGRRLRVIPYEIKNLPQNPIPLDKPR